MGFIELIIEVCIGLFLLSTVIDLLKKFVKVVLESMLDEEANKKDEKEEKEYSPLEKELNNIKPGALTRTATIANYIASLYKEPHIHGIYDIERIVSMYLKNQLSYFEEYNDHVIYIYGEVQTIGKDDSTKEPFFSLGNGNYYHTTQGSDSVREHIKCFLNEKYLEDDNYKKIVLNMKPGAKVYLVGVLNKGYFSHFELLRTILIKVDDIVPEKIEYTAIKLIHKKFEAKD